MARAKRRGPKAKPKSRVTLPPFGGDHGTGTMAAMAGTVLVPVLDENGKNPTREKMRRKINVIDSLTLTMRQEQAARAIEQAFCGVEMLSSGGGGYSERVQSSPKPDATIAHTINARSNYVYIMKGVLRVDRAIIEHVCFHNLPLSTFTAHTRQRARLAQALDRVADHMRY